MARRRMEITDEAAWNHTAQILALIYNANRGQRGRALRPADFHPYARAREQASPPVPEPITVLKETFVDQRPLN